MIERFNVRQHSNLIQLLEYIEKNNCYDFYYNEDAKRIYVNDLKSLKCFLRNYFNIFIKVEKGDVYGIVLVEKKTNTVKFLATNNRTLIDLLMVLIWNTKQNLNVNIKNRNPFAYCFKSKGFKFGSTQGNRVILERKYIPMDIKIYSKEEDLNDD